MNAEILCVGTELLLGDVINTNAAHIAKGLASIGVNVFYQTVVGDNPERLRDTISQAFSRSDLIILTGGLGPTFDDLTKETVAEYFGAEMELHQPSYDHLVEKFKYYNRGKNREMTPNNVKQAYMPKGAAVFQNQNGTANGLALSDGNKTAILLPGPPSEMGPMFDQQVMPYINKDASNVLISKNVHVFGMGESAVEDILHDYMLSLTNPTIAPYAKTGEMYLRVTASAKNREEAEKLIDPVIAEIQNKIGKYIYGIDVGSLQKAVVLALKDKGLNVATAESCTGGLISKLITDADGASDVFGCGVCSYSNDIKKKVLGVTENTLNDFGAVSEQTAAEMAKGVRKLSGADISIAVTGIAGPGGGSEEKPVGLVYIAIESEKSKETLKFSLSRGHQNEREIIRYVASLNALNMILKEARKF